MMGKLIKDSNVSLCLPKPFYYTSKNRKKSLCNLLKSSYVDRFYFGLQQTD